MKYYSGSLPCLKDPCKQTMPLYPVAQPAPQNVSALPTGYPTGPAFGPVPGTTGATLAGEQIAPQTVASTMYTPGYLKTQIGRTVRVEFLIGTNSLTDRVGTLIGVGASYILLRLIESDDILLGDIYSIKFVTFFY